MAWSRAGGSRDRQMARGLWERVKDETKPGSKSSNSDSDGGMSSPSQSVRSLGPDAPRSDSPKAAPGTRRERVQSPSPPRAGVPQEPGTRQAAGGQRGREQRRAQRRGEGGGGGARGRGPGPEPQEGGEGGAAGGPQADAREEEPRPPAAPAEPAPPALPVSVPKAPRAPALSFKHDAVRREEKDDISAGLASLMGRGRTKEHRARLRGPDRKPEPPGRRGRRRRRRRKEADGEKREKEEDQREVELKLEEEAKEAPASSAGKEDTSQIQPPVAAPGFIPAPKFSVRKPEVKGASRVASVPAEKPSPGSAQQLEPEASATASAQGQVDEDPVALLQAAHAASAQLKVKTEEQIAAEQAWYGTEKVWLVHKEGFSLEVSTETPRPIACVGQVTNADKDGGGQPAGGEGEDSAGARRHAAGRGRGGRGEGEPAVVRPRGGPGVPALPERVQRHPHPAAALRGSLIHTQAGLNMVIINPLSAPSMYSEKVMHMFKGCRREDSAPHVYGVAQAAYRSLLTTRQDQSVVLLGRSGSGKTSNAQHLVQYLLSIAGSSGKIFSVEKWQAVYTILEAFGNSATPMNGNASRFSQIVSLDFDQAGQVASASIQTMLLEKLRVTRRPEGEATFNVFYYMMAGADSSLRTELHFNHFAENSAFGIVPASKPEDKQRASQQFTKLQAAMKVLGITGEEQRAFWLILGAIYHLGAAGATKAGASSLLWSGEAAYLLGCTLEELSSAIFKHQPKGALHKSASFRQGPDDSGSGGRLRKSRDIHRYKQINCSKFTALECLEAIAASLYSEVFTLLISLINRALKSSQHSLCSLLIVDTPGFQNPRLAKRDRGATFEELCHNYAQERLQTLFHERTFTQELERYKEENIELALDDVEPSSSLSVAAVDQASSQALVRTMARTDEARGLLWLMEEEALQPGGSEDSLLERLFSYYGPAEGESKGHTLLLKSERPHHFLLGHSHGTDWVEYDARGWLGHAKQNPASLNAASLLQDSQKKNISSLFAGRTGGAAVLSGSIAGLEGVSQLALRRATSIRKTFTTGVAAVKKKSLCIQIKLQVDALLDTVRRSRLDVALLRAQLRGSKLLDALRIYRQGYPDHMVFSEFRRRFDVLAPHLTKKHGRNYIVTDEKRAVEELLESLDLEKSNYHMGLSRVFFRAGTLAKLEEQRDEQTRRNITLFQAACRGYLARQTFKKRKIQELAIRCIQKNIQKNRGVKGWPWWKLFTTVRPLIQVQLTEEQIRGKDEEIQQLKGKLEKVEKERNELRLNSDRLDNRITELSTELADERNAGESASQLLETETSERLRLEKDMKDLQAKFDAMKKHVGSMEMEVMEARLIRASELNGEMDDEDDDSGGEWRLKYERAIRESEFVKKRLQQECDDKVEAEQQSKRQLERRLTDLQADSEEVQRSVQQLKKKCQRLTAELQDTKLHLESQQTRNHDLEKKQRKRACAYAFSWKRFTCLQIASWRRFGVCESDSRGDLRTKPGSAPRRSSSGRDERSAPPSPGFARRPRPCGPSPRRRPLGGSGTLRRRRVTNACAGCSQVRLGAGAGPGRGAEGEDPAGEAVPGEGHDDRELFSLRQQLEGKDTEMCTVSLKVEQLEAELQDLSSQESKDEASLAKVKKQLRDLEAKVKDQEEELDEQAGTIQMLEQAKLRLEMEMERLRQTHSKEMESKDEEVEEIRQSCSKKLKQMEVQLEEEYDDKQKVLRERRDLESKLLSAQDQVGQRDVETEKRLKKDLKRTKVLLGDAQIMLDHLKNNAPSKREIAQLKNQLEESEFTCAAAVKSRKSMEVEIEDLHLQMDDISKAKMSLEEQVSRLQREKNDLQSRLEEDQEDMNELMKKHKAAISQSTRDLAQISDLQAQLEEAMKEKQEIQEKLQSLQSQLDFQEQSMVEKSLVSRQEAKIRELDTKLEFERTQVKRLESLVARLKENLEKMTEERDQRSSGENREKEQNKRMQRQLRDIKEETGELAKKEAEASRKKHELEMDIESLEAANQSLQADLKLAFKRIGDLQAAIEDEMESDDNDDLINSLQDMVTKYQKRRNKTGDDSETDSEVEGRVDGVKSWLSRNKGSSSKNLSDDGSLKSTRYAANADVKEAKEGKEGKEWKESGKEGKEGEQSRSASVMSSLSYRKRSNLKDSIGGAGDESSLFSAEGAVRPARPRRLPQGQVALGGRPGRRAPAAAGPGRRPRRATTWTTAARSSRRPTPRRPARAEGAGPPLVLHEPRLRQGVGRVLAGPGRASARARAGPGRGRGVRPERAGPGEPAGPAPQRLLAGRRARRLARAAPQPGPGPALGRPQPRQRQHGVPGAQQPAQRSPAWTWTTTTAAPAWRAARAASPPTAPLGRPQLLRAPSPAPPTAAPDASDVKPVSHRNYLDPDLEAAINEVLSFKPIKFKRRSLEDSDAADEEAKAEGAGGKRDDEEEEDEDDRRSVRSVKSAQGDLGEAGFRSSSSASRRSASALDLTRPASRGSSVRSGRSGRGHKGKKSRRSESESSSSDERRRRSGSSKKKGKKKSRRSSKRRDTESDSSSSSSSSESSSSSGASTISYRSSGSVKKGPAQRGEEDAEGSPGPRPRSDPSARGTRRRRRRRWTT
ncbi:hypothetical protein ANANG_G00150580 [Anguilla anguilla]|uniref:Myosin motor domain-containing protein n=1 Tax=Anguilla anguilla TaxID=7936 RepID=A0A9D3RUD4_ANGAN|nr:hypothetical protein ANANG_G00150580 [Anguilla anguilla]